MQKYCRLLKEVSMSEKSSFVPEETLEAIRRDLLPLIKEACSDTSQALSERPDRFGEPSMGYAAWEHCRNGICETLKEAGNWRLSDYENDLVLTCMTGDGDFSLRVCRVDPKTRLPTSGKRARQGAVNWLYFSEELRDLSRCGHVLGYDATIPSGLGKITLQRLYCTDGRNITSITLATLYDAALPQAGEAATPQENLPKAKPSRRKEPVQPTRKAVNR
jgi:hypothetical protein